MNGKLDVEEDVMDDSVIANRKAAAVMKTVSGKLSDVIATLGWDCYDDVVVEMVALLLVVSIKEKTTTKNGQHLMVFVSITKMRLLLSKIAHVLHLNHQNLFQRVNSNHVILMR